MLANTQEIELDAVPDLPPPNWYTDPTDESQYRYWDGSVWTEHRAPRYAEVVREGLRGSGELLGDAFSLIRRQWRGCGVAALGSIAGQIMVTVLFLFTADNILMGELGEIWERVTEPGYDPTTRDDDAYFESLEFDFSWVNFAPAVLGLMVVWVTGNLFTATVVLLALGDLRGRALGLPNALRQALRRVPRLMGLQLQFAVLGIVALVIVVLPALAAPALLFLLIPALIATVFLSMAVISLAYVVAAAGPSELSLRYAVRLVRGRFWGALGRMLLVTLVVMVFSFVFSMVFGFATSSLGEISLLGQAVNTVVSIVLGLLGTIASVIIYHDLGGDWEQDPG